MGNRNGPETVVVVSSRKHDDKNKQSYNVPNDQNGVSGDGL